MKGSSPISCWKSSTRVREAFRAPAAFFFPVMAAAAARPTDPGAEKTRKALDNDELEGREAVKRTKRTERAAPPPDPPRRQATGRRLNRVA